MPWIDKRWLVLQELKKTMWVDAIGYAWLQRCPCVHCKHVP